MKSHPKYSLWITLSIMILVLCTSISQSSLQEVTLDDSTIVKYSVKNGRLNGSYSSFYSNGQERAIGTFLNNQRTGVWSVYDSTGNLRMKRNYETPFIFKRITPEVPTTGPIPLLSKPVYYPKKNDAGFIEYFYLHERMIVWLRRVWRTISPENNGLIFEDNKLFNRLQTLIEGGQIVAYHPKNDMFTDSLNPNQIDWNNLTVVKYKIKEETFFDNERLIAETRILGICPVVIISTDTFDLCWLYYPEIRPHLAQITTDENEMNSIDDFFFYRDFTSSIYKVSNIHDRDIKDYAENYLLESIKQEMTLVEAEHDIWINMTEIK